MELSDEQIKRLEAKVRRSKVAQEEAAKSLEDLDRKIAGLFANKEMSHKEYSKLITEVIAPSHQVISKDD
jgi:hypothetical protein